MCSGGVGGEPGAAATAGAGAGPITAAELSRPVSLVAWHSEHSQLAPDLIMGTAIQHTTGTATHITATVTRIPATSTLELTIPTQLTTGDMAGVVRIGLRAR